MGHERFIPVCRAAAFALAVVIPVLQARGQEAPPRESMPAAADSAPAAAAGMDAGRGAVRLTSPGTDLAVTVGPRQLRELAGKLAAFGKGLSPEERLTMDWLLQRAGSAPADPAAGVEVHGTLFTPPRLVAGGTAIPDTASAGTPDEGDGERTTEITPAPPAALAKALGLNLLQMEGGAPGSGSP
ncbi:MAG: hypothetical protein ABR599_06345 [Gemmatimonadota bacterium]